MTDLGEKQASQEQLTTIQEDFAAKDAAIKNPDVPEARDILKHFGMNDDDISAISAANNAPDDPDAQAIIKHHRESLGLVKEPEAPAYESPDLNVVGKVLPAVQGYTGGTAIPAASAVYGLGKKVLGGEFGKGYSEAQKYLGHQYGEMYKENPKTALIEEVGASFASPASKIVKGVGIAQKAIPFAKYLPFKSATAGALAAGQVIGSQEEPLSEESLNKGANAAAWGAGGQALLGSAGNFLSRRDPNTALKEAEIAEQQLKLPKLNDTDIIKSLEKEKEYLSSAAGRPNNISARGNKAVIDKIDQHIKDLNGEAAAWKYGDPISGGAAGFITKDAPGYDSVARQIMSSKPTMASEEYGLKEFNDILASIREGDPILYSAAEDALKNRLSPIGEKTGVNYLDNVYGAKAYWAGLKGDQNYADYLGKKSTNMLTQHPYMTMHLLRSGIIGNPADIASTAATMVGMNAMGGLKGEVSQVKEFALKVLNSPNIPIHFKQMIRSAGEKGPRILAITAALMSQDPEVAKHLDEEQTDRTPQAEIDETKYKQWATPNKPMTQQEGKSEAKRMEDMLNAPLPNSPDDEEEAAKKKLLQDKLRDKKSGVIVVDGEESPLEKYKKHLDSKKIR